MPYSGADDPDLPSNVKKMSDKDRRQWVAIWNSTYDSCTKDGGEKADCESKAFKSANGVLKKESVMDPQVGLFQEIYDNLSAAARKIGEFLHPRALPENDKGAQLRAVSMPNLYDQFWTYLEGIEGDWAWPVNIFAEDDGKMFGIFTQSGKLYRVDLNLSGGSAAWSNQLEVVETFNPVTQQAVQVRKQSDETYRWYIFPAATSVINRNGFIDSRDLFDDLVRNAYDNGKMPYATIFHLDQAFRVGMTDFVARDDNCLLMSGTFDDSELAVWMRQSLEKESDYWGASISFWPTADPELVEVAQDISIPVYNKGYLEEVSFLPEESACSLFTAQSVNREVRKVNEKVLEALGKIAPDEASRQKLVDKIDEVNRSIVDNNLVTRSTEGGDPASAPVDQAQASSTDGSSSTDATATTDTATDPAVAEVTHELELDDVMLQSLANAVIQNDGFKIMMQSVVDAAVSMHKTALEGQQKVTQDLQTTINSLQTRLAQVEQTDDQKLTSKIKDVSRSKEVSRVTYRPSGRVIPTEPVTQTQQSTQPNLADVAASTLAVLE